MNRRLRKKLRRGEFTQYGFGLDLEYVQGLSQADYELALDQLIEVIEYLGLNVGGGGSRLGFGGFVTRYKGTCTDDDLSRVKSLLGVLPHVSKVTVGPLVDAWK
jgi:uncharacterized protein YggL (DUF469 family)